MQTVHLDVDSREALSHGQLNTLRKQGWLPAVVYGYSDKKVRTDAALMIKINTKYFLKTIGDHKSSNVIVDLKIGQNSVNAVIKEMQRDAVTRNLIHVDFQRISMTDKIEVMVPVHLVGEAPGVKLHGGILEHIAREIKILSLPKDIPSVINVDISKMEIGEGMHVSDLPVIPGVEVLTDGHGIIVHVVVQAVVEQARTVAAVSPPGTGPEVISKGKTPEEGEAVAAGKPGEKAAAPKAGAPKTGASGK